jgi:undecaprenyl diphosphate synthase
MSFIERINPENLPKHVAIIMDGNGRWANQQGKNRIFGHKNGVEAARKITEAAARAGIKYLTLYAFSKENWNRPRTEVAALMTLLVSSMKKYFKQLADNNIQFDTIGDIASLPKNVQEALSDAKQKTKDNTGMTLIWALSYGSRWEIINAVKNITKDNVDGKISIDSITEESFSTYLNTSRFPDPELIIRTSGEYRMSNFLMWQAAYSELFFTEKLWPDFTDEDFYSAIIDYQQRERRFGKTGEQIKNQQ